MLAFDEMGFLRARVAMRCFELELTEAEVTGLMYAGLGSSTREAEVRIRVLDELFTLLLIVPPERRREWMRSPNRELGDSIPVELASTFTSGVRAVRNVLRDMHVRRGSSGVRPRLGR